MKRIIRYLLALPLVLLMAGISFADDKTVVFSTHLKQGSELYSTTSEILEEAFGRCGYSFILHAYPGKRALFLSNSGATDGEAHRIYGIDKKYPNLVRIPEVQQIIHNYAYATKPVQLDSGWKSLSTYRVAVQRGSVFVTKMAKENAKSVDELDSFESIFKFVNAGRADLAIGTPFLVSIVLQKTEYDKMNFKRIEPPLTALPIFAYLHKKHTDLVPQVAEAIHEMKLDGSYQKIMQRLNK